MGYFVPELLDTHRVLLGRDMRLSSPALHEAVLNGLLDAGAEVWDLGLSTTPFVSRSDLGRLFGLLPEDHYCFGTDWPIYRPEEEMRRLKKKTDWSDDRLERLMGNAASLLADYGMLDGTRGA